MNFSPQTIIDKYELGTASLEQRLEAARKVQDGRGFRVGIVIEPIIRYVGYENDYVDLVNRILTTLDLNRIDSIVLSCVRFSGKLEARVRRNFPDTDLFDDSQGLLPLVKGDRRRYPLDERVRLYTLLFDAIRRHSTAYVRVGAETSDVWDALGWDRKGLIDSSVYQYPGDNNGALPGQYPLGVQCPSKPMKG